ncbi:MAG TPA: GAF domain-containing protein [Pyrinomonadaceae bacterium]|nr:GAF domain-containing protein [Pyrinomonadaceae bacterium]
MAESVAFSKTADRSVIYSEITPQIDALISDEPDLTANLANVTAVLKEALGFFWVGFYLKKQDQLVLGPFQGPVACTRIDFGKGVCGHAYSTAETVIVPNVDEFPGHIACSSDAKSEIVVPIFDSDRKVFGVLDVDSDRLNDFSDVDRDGLTQIVNVIERVIRSHTNSDKLE